MFRKLRNKLIWINLGITSVVIIMVFTAIYLFSTNMAKQRPPMPEMGEFIYSDDFENVIDITIRNEKQAAAQDLLITLIVSGCTIELIVAIVSYFLAEEAIKPVRTAYEAQKVFITNASHEIKTPLAAISANLEAADIHGNKWIANVERETEKLSALNSELLTLARTDLVDNVTVEEVDLAEVVATVVQGFEPRMSDIGFRQEVSISGRTKINVTDFRQILSILMDNAVKYSEKEISLGLSEHELIIANDGAKISKKELPHVFDRFYQVDKSAEGVGLGLSIARSLADRNGWSLSAESDSKMTKFLLKF